MGDIIEVRVYGPYMSLDSSCIPCIYLFIYFDSLLP